MKRSGWLIGEYYNEGMTLDSDDFTSHNETQIDEGSIRRVAFERDEKSPETSTHTYDNEIQLESEEIADLQPILVPLAKRRSFSTARLKFMRKIDDALAEKIFFVEQGTGGLFPKLNLDNRTVHRNILNKQKPTIFQKVAYFNHKFGLRHYLLILILAAYSLLGGLMFMSLESRNELEQLEYNIKQLELITQNLSNAIFKISRIEPDDNLSRSSVFLIRDFYERMLKVEGRYIGSVYHKYKLLDQLTWSYTSAIFYAMTLFTTIGYGSIVCQTLWGKIMSIVYAIIGIPLMLVVLSDIGKVLLYWFTHAYNGTRRGIRHILIKSKPELSKIEEADDNALSIKSWNSENSEDDKPFPMYLTVPIIVIYLLLCSLIISTCDARTDLNPGLSFGNAFYFSFISVSTIGLGDVLPNNIEYNPLVALMFLFGLALLSVVNTTIYEKIEQKLMDSVRAMENWLENVHYYRKGREGYYVFKSLSPNIQLLALALPLFNDIEEESIEAMLDNRISYQPPTRSRSLIEQNIDKFKPTIGVLHIGNKPERDRSSTFTEYPHHDHSTNYQQRSLSTQECGLFYPRQISRSQSHRSYSIFNPNFITSPILRTLSERVSSNSSSDVSNKH